MRRLAATAFAFPFKRIPARLTLSILSGGAACRAVFRCVSNEKPSRAGGTSGQRAACCSGLPSPPQNSPSCLSEPSDLPNIKERALAFANALIGFRQLPILPGRFQTCAFRGLECYLNCPAAFIHHWNGPVLNTKRKATFFRISLYWIPATTYPPGPFPAKYFQRLEA